MLYRREGFPEEGELVLATITKIMYSSVFANLDEFDKSGLIHISEVSPGRIRNLREYVTVGKKVVCKVLRIDRIKGHIDLSLRRVNEMERRNKNEEIKQEQKAEKTIELVAIQTKNDVKKLYNQVTDKLFQNYSHVYLFFKEVAEGSASISSLELDKNITDILKKVVEERFKPPKVQIKGTFTLKSFASDGVSVIKDTFQGVEKLGDISVSYLSGGRYRAVVTAENYKSAENILKKLESKILDGFEKEGKASFDRE